MAGTWTYTGAAEALNTRGGPDDGEKVTAAVKPGASNALWWPDFCWKVGQLFSKECQRLQTNVATVTVSANNSTGDTSGIGTLAITIVTA